jgi:hypothetical protein
MKRRLSAAVVALVALVAIASPASARSGLFISSAVENGDDTGASRDRPERRSGPAASSSTARSSSARADHAFPARLTRPARPA